MAGPAPEPPPIQAQRAWWHDDRKVLGLLVAAALAVRVGVALLTPVIHIDGGRFSHMARLFAAGRWDEGLDYFPRMTPLYPILINLFGDGAMVSAVCGAMTLLPIYFLTIRIWDRPTALLAAIICAFLPQSVYYGGQWLSEAPFVFFFFTALFFVYRAAEDARFLDFLAVGLAGGAALMVRPEGIYVLPAIVGWSVIRGFRRGAWLRRIGGMAAAVIVVLAIAFPYMRWIHAKTGRWDFSDSQVIGLLKFRMGLSHTPVEIPARGRGNIDSIDPWYRSLGGYLLCWLKLSSYVFVFPLLVGFSRIRREPGPLYVLLVGLAYSIPPLMNCLFSVWFVRRYIYPGFIWWSPIMALGLLAIARKCPIRVPEPIRRRLLIGALTVLLAGLLGYELYQSLDGPLEIKKAGLWIRKNGPPHPILLGTDRRVDYYAGAFGYAPDMTVGGLQRQVRSLHPDFIFTIANERETPEYMESVAKFHDLVQVIPKLPRRGEVRIYRVRTPAD
jgi:hypothetical protein